ncbi:MAG: hypothetical protein HYR91_09405, partial [Flavobacteriia bacterium]|nr:hypothetical protein [Flavobacteriia bacterium]
MAKQRKISKPRSSKSKKKSTKKSKRFWIYFTFLILIVGLFIYLKFSTKKINKDTFVQQIPKGFESFGIDISHHQGIIDWNILFNQEKFDTIIQFVYCKATEGSTHVDTRWDSNRNSLNNRGIPNGAYHFFSSKDAPLPQVNHFLNYWKKREVDLPPVLDVETEGFSDDDLRAKMLIWLKAVENKTGMRPIIYTSLNFYETKFKDYFKDYKFWIAAYSRKPECINDSRILHWQYSESGNLPGFQ